MIYAYTCTPVLYNVVKVYSVLCQVDIYTILHYMCSWYQVLQVFFTPRANTKRHFHVFLLLCNGMASVGGTSVESRIKNQECRHSTRGVIPRSMMVFQFYEQFV